MPILRSFLLPFVNISCKEVQNAETQTFKVLFPSL